MALFSRRNQPTGDSDAPASDTSEQIVETAEPAPAVGISVQAFRGVGEEAGPAVALTESQDTAESVGTHEPEETPVPRLPLASPVPPEQTETVAGMKDNVLLRETLKEIDANVTNEQILGVLRQCLQGHLYIQVTGDARAQITEGAQLSVAIVSEGDQRFMLAFSSAAAVRDSVALVADRAGTSAVAQPVTAVLKQVVAGGFTGIIIDNASAPHRAVFPSELLQKVLEQADEEMTIKSILAVPREQDSAAKVGEALAAKRMWVAANDGGGTGEFGIAEARATDGRRFLQLFTHPLEILALGRGDRPLPFDPEQLAKALTGQPDLAGVVVDPAGPLLVVERDALGPVLELAADA